MYAVWKLFLRIGYRSAECSDNSQLKAQNITSHVAAKTAEQICIVIGSIIVKTKWVSKFWVRLVDYTCSPCNYKKSDLSAIIYQGIVKPQQQCIKIEITRCINAGESLAQRKRLDALPNLNINFDYRVSHKPE